MTASSLQLSGPGALVGSLPTLVGFVPHESFVFVGLMGRRVVVTGRFDLAQPDHTLKDILGIMPRLADQIDTIALVVWSDTSERYADTLRAAQNILQSPHLNVMDAILTDGRAYRSVDCTDTACCPGVVAAPDGLLAALKGTPARSREDIEEACALREPVTDTTPDEIELMARDLIDTLGRDAMPHLARKVFASLADGHLDEDSVLIANMIVGGEPDGKQHRDAFVATVYRERVMPCDLSGILSISTTPDFVAAVGFLAYIWEQAPAAWVAVERAPDANMCKLLEFSMRTALPVNHLQDVLRDIGDPWALVPTLSEEGSATP